QITRPFGVPRPNHEEVALGVFGANRGLSTQDAVGTLDDSALPDLAKDHAEPRYRHDAALDQICEQRPRAHRGKLIDVADEYDAGRIGHREKEALGETHVDHGRLVDDE